MSFVKKPDHMKHVFYKLSTIDRIPYLYIPDLKIGHFFTIKSPYNINSLKTIKGIITVKQVHGNSIFIIDKPVDDISSLQKEAMENPSDAIITNQSNIGIGVFTADCVPVILYDDTEKIVAVVHAGWRGSIKGIISMVIKQMVKIFHIHPANIKIILGPFIGSCCYTVGKVVIEELQRVNSDWNRYLIYSKDGKTQLDLKALNIYQAEAEGIRIGNIYSIDLCTSCNKELFFSYRRDGIGTGRMLNGIFPGWDKGL